MAKHAKKGALAQLNLKKQKERKELQCETPVLIADQAV